ncbi:MAG: exo-alpha-sialidase [Actinomycetota bacterium]|nr:exo-alpha-sialidase [Actinomycetota bacterium]
MKHRQGVHARAVVLVLIVAGAATLLAACSSPSGSTTPASPEAASSRTQTLSPTEEPVASGEAVSTDSLTGHVHNLVLVGTKLYFGTHDGIWSQQPGQQPVRVSDEVFDTMGLTRTGSTWLASGHPGPEMDAPNDLGLGISTNGGQTWTKGSLGGQVDFHRLVATNKVVMGLASNNGVLWRTANLGRTWKQLGTPELFDLALDPANDTTVLGTSPTGVMRSINGGTSFDSVPGAPLLALLAASRGQVVGVDIDGKVYTTTDGGSTWIHRGQLAGQPIALAAEGSRVAALVGDAIMESLDGGRTFQARLTGVGAGAHG